mmetsp:Transcript_40948/g.131707  ORF Transcript_40948/g.131707 Transcript_40948/m.131707 type:complete len:144 (-) Transcript_40948:604-1035(-)
MDAWRDMVGMSVAETKDDSADEMPRRPSSGMDQPLPRARAEHESRGHQLGRRRQIYMLKKKTGLNAGLREMPSDLFTVGTDIPADGSRHRQAFRHDPRPGDTDNGSDPTLASAGSKGRRVNLSQSPVAITTRTRTQCWLSSPT